jgi:hypothetical protein
MLTIVLAAAGGFVLAQALPLVLKLLDDARLKIRCERLAMERQQLVGEWELPVARRIGRAGQPGLACTTASSGGRVAGETCTGPHHGAPAHSLRST